MRAKLLAALLISLAAASAHGQQCQGTDTVLQCFQRYNPSIAAAQQMVATTNTGVPDLTAPTGSSLRDFLSLFMAGVKTGTITQNGESVTLDWNVPFNIFGDDKIKLQAIFTEAELSTDVKTQLAANSAAMTTLSDSLTETDDIQASATYSAQNGYFGRSIRNHDELLTALIDSAIDVNEKTELLLLARTDFRNVTTSTQLKDLPAATAAQIESSAKAEQKLGAAETTVVKAFATLLNNQPQIYGSAVYHYRDRLAGPKELSAKFTFETSGNNLNRFLRSNRDRCGTPAQIAAQANGLDVSTTCVGSLVAFANQIPGDVAARGSNRLAASFEYKKSDANQFTLTDPAAVTVNTPGSHSLIYSITYGMPMDTTVQDREGRLEVAVNYEDVSNDPMRTDRLIASITYSQKLTDTLTLPLSLVYANHADYLPTTDKRVGVHFGLNYKLPDPTP